MDVSINYWAVLVAAVINMAVGATWYSNVLFARPWMAAIGRKKDELGMATSGYAVSMLVALVQNFILAHFVDYANATTLLAGVGVSLMLWLAFVGGTMALNTSFSGRPWKLWAIDAGYFLVVMVINGALLATWR